MGFQINQSTSGRRNFRPQPMSEINVTPFVDVMLVLLVVFMITAPMLSQGVSVNLPQVESQAMTEEVEPLEVSVRKDGVIYLQSNEISQRELLERLTAIRASKPGTGVLLRADTDVAYGTVMQVMGALQSAGIVDVGMMTEPPAVR